LSGLQPLRSESAGPLAAETARWIKWETSCGPLFWSKLLLAIFLRLEGIAGRSLLQGVKFHARDQPSRWPRPV
jgi:hypothetical protein